jgi:hypothetical protein
VPPAVSSEVAICRGGCGWWIRLLPVQMGVAAMRASCKATCRPSMVAEGIHDMELRHELHIAAANGGHEALMQCCLQRAVKWQDTEFGAGDQPGC